MVLERVGESGILLEDSTIKAWRKVGRELRGRRTIGYLRAVEVYERIVGVRPTDVVPIGGNISGPTSPVDWSTVSDGWEFTV